MGGEGSRKALVAIFGYEGELYAVGDLCCGPVEASEAGGAAVEGIAVIVVRKGVGLAFEREGSLGLWVTA